MYACIHEGRLIREWLKELDVFLSTNVALYVCMYVCNMYVWQGPQIQTADWSKLAGSGRGDQSAQSPGHPATQGLYRLEVEPAGIPLEWQRGRGETDSLANHHHCWVSHTTSDMLSLAWPFENENGRSDFAVT